MAIFIQLKHIHLFMKNLFPIICSALVFVLFADITFGQEYFGTVSSIDGSPVEYVNIGIPLKSTGTVSDINGKFSINLTDRLNTDSIRFSCIGYKPFSIAVKDFISLDDKAITLVNEIYSIQEATVFSKRIKDKVFGVESYSKMFTGGFSKVELGYEFGILMHNSKRAYLKSMGIRIATCDFDSLFFRLNIYCRDKSGFENILKEPIYVSVAKLDIKEMVVVDLKPYNISVDSDFLVALEIVKDLGKGKLQFNGSMLRKTYIRNTSQDKWIKVPLGAGILVEAKVEES